MAELTQKLRGFSDLISRLQLPATEPGELLAVAADVHCLRLSMVNVFFCGPPGAPDRSWVLVDAGMLTSGSAIRSAAAELYGAGSRPAAIVLTHGHFDHTGVVRDLANEWDVPVCAHPLEFPYLDGRSAYPPPDPTVGGGLMTRLSPLYPKGPVDLRPRLQALPEDHSVPGMPGWQWLHTPGHTPGHISLFRDDERLLIAGDAFVTTKQESAIGALMKWPHAVYGPPAYFTPDWDSARDSVRLLAALRPETAVTGHGNPMSGEMLRQQLDHLAARFDELVRPSHGRYVRRPAITDERGVISVPPPVSDPVPAMVAGVAAVVAIGLLLRRR